MSPLVIDIGCVVVVFLSLLIGYFRGFIQSLLSVLSWIVAAWGTWQYADLVIPHFADFNLDPALQVIAANLALFFALLLAATVISALISRVIVVQTIVGIDRTLGAAFGIARGVLIVMVLALVSSFAFMSDASWWSDSVALAILEPYVMQMRDLVSPYLTPELLTS